MTLVILLLVLVIPYLALTILGRQFRGLQITASRRARVGLTLFFLFTSIPHFLSTEAMAAMIPPFVPFRTEMIYFTGVLEILGAIGVWIPGLVRITGWLLIVMLIGLLPANIYSAVNRVEFGGHAAGPIYLLVRVPFQLFVICWTYFATRDDR